MQASIIICTRNRAEHLSQTLAAMAETCVPEATPAELIVVDNDSRDDTAETIRVCRLPKMTVRYIYEPRRGQCHARNTGIAAAQGEVILFTDDDVRPPHNWIAGMCQPILSGKADAVAGGVHLAPHLLRDWLSPQHRGWLASTEVLDPMSPNHMVGANMAFSRSVLEKVPWFDTDLGPGALGFYDETLFSWQLREAGFRLVSAFDVPVEHHFDGARLSRESFLISAQKMGRSQAYVEYHWQHKELPLARRHLIKRSLRLAYLRCRSKPFETETVSIDELMVLRQIWLLKQYIKERKQTRKYDKHGLKKCVEN